MQYSVSPRVNLSIFGPNPSENVSTRTPRRRAARKCPSSCTKISTPRTKRNDTRVVTRGSSTFRLYGQSFRLGPGPGVHLPDELQCYDGFHRVGVQRLLDHGGNRREPETPLEKRRHRHLV